MSLRTIMVFPEFSNMALIDDIRDKYDPLAQLVKPHITLVFPFESTMSDVELVRVLDERLNGIKSFELKLKGFGKQENSFGNYLFLNVKKGREELDYINHILYTNELKEYDIGVQYVPHMTVGKLPTNEMLNMAYKAVESIDDVFSAIVKKISVEMIGDNEESIIIIEKELID